MAMKRSGHHALINWIGKQHGSLSHINNAAMDWEHKSFRSIYTPDDYGDDPQDVLISIEDFDPRDWSKYEFTTFPLLRDAEHVYPILFMRDFKNWLASCYARKHLAYPYNDVYAALDRPYLNDRQDHKDGRLEIYCRQWNEFLMPLNIHPCYVYSYNKWATMTSYRRNMALELGLTFTDEGHQDVPRFGKGSSFDGTTFDGKASEMDIEGRWIKFQKDPEFQEILTRYADIIQESDNRLLS